MESLETIGTRQLVTLLSSSNNGAQLPGIVTASLPADVQGKAWELVLRRNGLPLSLRLVRPFYHSTVLVSLSVCGLSDKLAREITPLHFPALEVLEIEDSPSLTDVGIALGITGFESLDCVRLSGCFAVTSKSLVALPQARVVEIKNSMYHDGKHGSLDASRILRSEELILEGSTRGGMNGFILAIKNSLSSNDFSPIKSLVIKNSPAADDELAELISLKMKNLIKLEISFGAITSWSLRYFSQLPQLETLILHFNRIAFTEANFGEIFSVWAQFQQLRSLCLSGIDVSPRTVHDWFGALSKCPRLEYLSIESSGIVLDKGNTDLYLLMAKLRRLDLSSNGGIRDAPFDNNHHPICSKLELIDLSRTGVIQPRMILNKAFFPALHTLIVDDSKVNDNFLLRILYGNIENDSGWNLSRVSLRRCPKITDGVLEFILTFPGFPLRPTLRWLDITGTKTSARVRHRLRRSCPHCDILPHDNESEQEEQEPGGLADEDEEVDELEAQEDDEEEGFWTDERALRRFVHGLDELNGSAPDGKGRDSSMSGQTEPYEEEEMQVIVDDNYKKELISMCCTCQDCTLNQWGSSLRFDKIRYSKDELNRMRPAKKE